MKKCQQCGGENPSWTAVCNQCGQPLAGEMEVETHPPVMALGLPLAERSAAHELPPPPGFLRVLGIANVAIGLALPAVNFLLVSFSIQKFQRIGLSETPALPLWITIWTFAGLGILLASAGIGLINHAPWGRVLSMICAVLLFLGACVGTVDMHVAKALAEVEYNGPPIYIEFVGAVPAFTPFYGVLTLVLMLLPVTRNWARGVRAVKKGIPLEQVLAPTPAPPVYTLAVISMVLSMVPFLLITQAVSLIMGMIALRTIRNSQGRLGGRGFAWAGVIISSLILLAIGGLLATVLVFLSLEKH